MHVLQGWPDMGRSRHWERGLKPMVGSQRNKNKKVAPFAGSVD